MSEYKRKYRELDDDTKQKISQSSKGKPKSYSHRQHLSQSLTDYWKTVPSRKGIDNNHVKPSNGDE